MVSPTASPPPVTSLAAPRRAGVDALHGGRHARTLVLPGHYVILGSPECLDLLEAALTYARRGWHVFPVEPGGKRPLGSLVRTGHLEATTDPEQIRGWWALHPNANVGISLEPSGICVLDVDTANGKPGMASLAEIDALLTPTLAASTGRGGLHAVYQRPPGLEPARRIGFRPGLDLLGKGYIVAAPSVLAEGRGYSWSNSEDVVPLPAALVDAFGHQAPLVVSPGEVGGSPVSEGGRNNALFKLGAALRDTGIGELAIQAALIAENQRRNTPPLPDAEVMAVASSVFRRVEPTRDVMTGAEIERTGGLLGGGLALDLADTPLVSKRLHEIADKDRPPVRSYKTGIPQLDMLLGGGISTRQLAVLAAPPGAGKSALAVTWGLHLQAIVPILNVSTELETDELAARHAAPLIGCSWRDLVRGDVSMRKARSLLAELRIHVIGAEELPRKTEDALVTIAREIQGLTKLHGIPPLTIVDYVQDLARGSGADVRGKIGDIASNLRAITQVMDCAMLGVSSVSRNYYGASKQEALRQSDDATNYLAVAKESGDIDYAAAVVMFLDVDNEAKGDTRPARIAVAKSRHGQPGFAGARFHGASGKWSAAPEALEELTSDARSGRREREVAALLEGRILKVSAESRMGRDALALRVGGNRQATGRAISVMLEDGRLISQSEYIAASRKTIEVIVPADTPATIGGIVDPTSTAAAWLPREKPPTDKGTP